MENNILPRTDLNDRYKEIRGRGIALEWHANDLIKILKIQGLTLERIVIEKELQDIQAQVTGIKLRYPDIISITSTSMQEARREDFQDHFQDIQVPIEEQLYLVLKMNKKTSVQCIEESQFKETRLDVNKMYLLVPFLECQIIFF